MKYEETDAQSGRRHRAGVHGDGQRANSPEVAETFRKHLLGGIRWALGITGNQTKP